MKTWIIRVSLPHLLREAVASSKSQPIVSLLTVVIVACMCLSVLLTAGRTSGAQRAVLSSLDEAGTRSILIEADDGTDLDSSVVSRLEMLDGAEWVGGFSSPRDVTNTSIPGSDGVPARVLVTSRFATLSPSNNGWLDSKTAYVSPRAQRELGMMAPSGSLTTDDGLTVGVTGAIGSPTYLTFLEPLVVIPKLSDSDPIPLRVVVVVVAKPSQVALMTEACQSLLGVRDLSKVHITSSQSLAAVRSGVENTLGAFAGELVLATAGLSAILLSLMLTSFVLLRRKDYGRRRALGASRAFIFSLLLLQVALLSIVGSAVGCAAALANLSLVHDPFPSTDYSLSIFVLGIGTSLVATIAPAMLASSRDPLRELRVP